MPNGNDTVPIITLDPDPPERGNPCRVRISGANYPVILTVRFTPPGTDQQIEIEDDDGEDVTPPSDADTMKVSGGGADAVIRVVA